MSKAFQQGYYSIIFLLCFAIVFQPDSAAMAYGYDELSRLTDEIADSSGSGYDANYTYDIVGNRTLREITVNSQPLTTEYTYYQGTDKLHKETHTGPVYSFYLHDNDRYYAYAAPNGGFFYRDAQGRKIGGLQAFFMGLPSVWSQYLFILAMALIPLLLFGPAVIKLISRLLLCYGAPTRLRLRVPRKGICLLVAFVMLFGPENFQQLAQAEMQYANLGTASWANGDTNITYTYDANGSVETKTTVTGSVVKEVVTNHYNLAGRLDKVTTNKQVGTENIVEYIYNDDGIRVRAYSYDQPTGGGTKSSEKTVIYLIDSYNHTGYAQTLEELTFIDNADPDPLTETPDSLRTYLLGDDVIAQNTDGTAQYLLYDGHDSTRQLAQYSAGSVSVVYSYSYDGYGVLLQNDSVASVDPGKVAPQATSMLYAGEQFDNSAQMYYLRARYYDPLNGRFNQVDPFAGNYEDPISLHKYLYCHNNPISGIDPSGESSLTETLAVSLIIGAVMGSVVGYIRGGVSGALAGLVSGAISAPLCTLGVLGAGLGIAAMLGISATSGVILSFALAVTGSLAWSTYEIITAKNDRERLAAGVMIIFTLGFAAFGAYKFSKIPSLPNSASRAGVLPSSRSAWGEFLSEAAALLRGERVVARQVTVKTLSNIRVRVDLVVRTLRGRLKFIDSKFGPSARFTVNQKVAYPEIGQYGGTIQGNNAASAGLPPGTRIGPTDVQIDTWNGAVLSN